MVQNLPKKVDISLKYSKKFAYSLFLLYLCMQLYTTTKLVYFKKLKRCNKTLKLISFHKYHFV